MIDDRLRGAAGGIALVLFFNVMQAASAIFLHSFLQAVNVFVVLFYTFLTISLTFGIRLFWASPNGLSLTKPAIRSLFGLNFTTAISWSSFFLAVQYIEPTIATSVINAVLPLATLAVGYAFFGRQAPNKAEATVSVALLLSLVFVVGAGMTAVSLTQAGQPSLYVVGVVMSAVCGVAMAFSTVTSKQLNQLGVRPAEIMAFRFYVVTLGAGCLGIGRGLMDVPLRHPWTLAFVVIAGHLLPLFALQLGIQRLRPITVAFLIGLAPLIFLIAQTFGGTLEFSLFTFASVLFTSAAILAGTYVSMARR